jgi:hypothetical protein
MSFSEIFQSHKGSKEPHSNRTICELHRELYDLCVMNLYEKNIELMKNMIIILDKAFIAGVEINRDLCRCKLGSSSKWDKKEYRNKEVNKKEVAKLRKEREKVERLLDKNNEILKKFNKK